MSKVFIPQMPSRFDAVLRTWIPTINVESAAEFGQVQIVLPPDAGRLGQTAMAKAVEQRMADFQEGDFLVGAGDPAIISLCAVHAAKKSNVLRMLRWDRISRTYNKLEFDL